MDFFDTHCHAHFPVFAGKTEEIIDAALQANTAMLLVGTNAATSRSAIQHAEKYPTDVYAAVGVHPSQVFRPYHDASENVVAPSAEMFDAEFMQKCLASKKLVGVGETGLDYYRLPEDAKDRETAIRLQQENFRLHVRFAHENNLPLIVHVRDAHDDVRKIVREISPNITGIIHCFSGNADDVRAYVALGFHISFSGTITYAPKKGVVGNPLAEALKATPSDRLLIETDSPYLAPGALRGGQNVPSNVALVAEAIAVIRGEELAEIAQKTTANARRLFRLAEAH